MGDDCIEEYVEGAEKFYESIGNPLKVYELMENGVSFCGMEFTTPNPKDIWPTNPAKGLYNYLNSARTPEQYDAIQFTLRQHPQRETILKFIVDHDCLPADYQ
jgi:hypothetical protein